MRFYSALKFSFLREFLFECFIEQFDYFGRGFLSNYVDSDLELQESYFHIDDSQPRSQWKQIRNKLGHTWHKRPPQHWGQNMIRYIIMLIYRGHFLFVTTWYEHLFVTFDRENKSKICDIQKGSCICEVFIIKSRTQYRQIFNPSGSEKCQIQQPYTGNIQNETKFSHTTTDPSQCVCYDPKHMQKSFCVHGRLTPV